MSKQYGAKHRQIAAIGECMVELSDLGNDCYRRSFAGDTLNTALYLARCLSSTEHKVSYVTALGEDPLSQAMVASWKKEGIDCDLVGYLPDKLPGLYSIQLDSQGERSFSYWRDNSAARKLFDGGLNQQQQDSLTNDFSDIYLSGITLAVLDSDSLESSSLEILLSLLQQSRNNGTNIIFDNNYRPSLWASKERAAEVVNRALALATTALVTFDDEQLLFGDKTPEDTESRLQHIPEVIVKNGGAGCLVSSDGATSLVPTQKVSNIVDTTAAGDSFNAGYLAARFNNYQPAEAAMFCTCTGGTGYSV